MGRSFAYLGIPPWHIFIGEIILAVFVVAGPRTASRSLLSVVRKTPYLAGLRKIFFIFALYGLFEVAHGIAAGYPWLTAVRDFAFNYYPLFFILGLWVGLRKPDLPPRFFRVFAWYNGIYGLSYIVFLNRLDWTFPGVSNQVIPVPIFGLPEFSFLVLLGLVAYEPELKRVWYLLALNGFVLLGMQIRAEWLGFAVGLLLWAYLTKHLKRMMAGGAIVILLLALMFALDFKMAGPTSRGGGEISAQDLIGRALAPINPYAAADYTSSYQTDLGTTVWRTIWWLAIWQAVNANHKTALFGFGYGYALGDLVPYLRGQFIQTPHNAFFYALGYSGWIGVCLFAGFQAALAHLLWKAYRKTGQPAGIVLWASMLAFATFTPFFEVPQGAIPFYLISGCVIASAIGQKRAVGTTQAMAA